MHPTKASRMLRRLSLPSVALALWLTPSYPVSAHYFYEQYATTSAPYSPIVEKFDLTALPTDSQNNPTVYFYISATPPTKFAPGDSFPALISEIRAAAQVWNHVSSSSLKLAYGGLLLAKPTSNTPYIYIEFSDQVPQGLYAISGPQAPLGTLTKDAAGNPFYPIQTSRMRLPNDLSSLPSYSELMFCTLVHEFGHTLGLQHTLASSVMSTYVTTGSTRATPLATDDIAGLSHLYPANNFLNNTGSVSGVVTYTNGAPANLASVTVIAPGLDAVTALTNPDGTYSIDGIPPGAYLVYVNPLPPPFEGESGNNGVIYPVGPDGKTAIPPTPMFATQFYPGTSQPSQATPVSVAAGVDSPNINFSVSPEPAPPVYGVRTYGYVTSTIAVIAPPFLIGGPNPDTLEATGIGLLANQQLLPGLSFNVLGSEASIVPGSARPYPAPYNYLAVNLSVGNQAASGPQHMLFQTSFDTYVLPTAFHLVTSPPPVTSSINSLSSRVLAITGQNFTPATRIYFDGIPGAVRALTPDGRLIVSAPPAPGAYTANVVALNPDGQSSLYSGAASPYVYDNAPTPSLQVSPATLPPGASTVDVIGVNTDFDPNLTRVGFGSPDAIVTQVNVLSPTHLQVFVQTAPGASIDTAQSINIANGLEIISPALGAQVTLQGQ
jgi:hypothetical protein